MDHQVFYLDNMPWQQDEHGSVGKYKIILDSNVSKSGSLKLLQLGPRETFNSHEHNFLQLMYFTKGTGSLIIDSNQFEIKPGMTAIVLPNQCHTVSNTSDQAMDIMVFETYEVIDTDNPYVDF